MSACQSEAQRAAEAARKDSLLHCTNNIPARFGTLIAQNETDSNRLNTNDSVSHEGMILIKAQTFLMVVNQI